MLNYEIEGGNLPVVICYPETGQTLCVQGGAMSWMSSNMNMETSAGGLKKAVGRLFSGESVFLNEYTPSNGSGMIALASNFPGTIIPYQVKEGESIIVQKTGFLAMEKGLDLSVYFQKSLGKGLFGGEGFIMQKISGNGLVFIEIDGYCKEYELAAGETIVVGTSHLAAMSETCSMDIETVKGAKNIFFGGEGLFLTRITGPGKVYLQSMPMVNVATKIKPYITATTSSSSSSSSSSNSGFKIKFGE